MLRPVGSGELMARLIAVFLRALDDAGDDRAADEIAPVQVLMPAAAQRDLEEAIVLPLAKLRVDDLRDDRVDRLLAVAVVLAQQGIERQVRRDVDAVRSPPSPSWSGARP